MIQFGWEPVGQSYPLGKRRAPVTDGVINPAWGAIAEGIRRKYLETRGLNNSVLNDLIAARNAARAAKNWAEADRIRDELATKDIVLKDNKDGTTTWEPKR